jgi:hypothetical protein
MRIGSNETIDRFVSHKKQPTDLELRIRREVLGLLGDASEVEGFSDPENKGKLLDILHEIHIRLNLLWGER